MSEDIKYVVLDHRLIPEKFLNREPLSVYDMFYEVVRIYEGRVAFLDDHINRMLSSLKLAGIKKRISKNQIYTDLSNCIKANGLENGNIRFSAFTDGKFLKFLHEIIPHRYPDDEEYENGVSLAVARFERERPNVKKWNQKMKDIVKRYVAIRDVYEILLYNEKGYLTEGSKSNLFFIVDNQVVTAPGEYVLKGITRKYVIKSILNLGLDFKEQLVHVTDLLKYDAVFITGTSPGVLPVNEIKSCCHADPKHPVLRSIMSAYKNEIEKTLI